MTLSTTDEASDDADRSSIGAAAAVHVMDSNTTGKFAQAHVAPSIDPASANVYRAPSSTNSSSSMVSDNNGFGVGANHHRQQYQQRTCMQQMQYMPPMHMPMMTVMPSLPTIPAQQQKQGNHPAFAATPLPAQASPTFGMGIMFGGGAHPTPQSGHPRASSKPSALVSFAALFALSVELLRIAPLHYFGNITCFLHSHLIMHQYLNITSAGKGRQDTPQGRPVRFPFM